MAKSSPLISVRIATKNPSGSLTRRSTNKQRILSFLRRDFWESAYVKVTYAPGYFNDGDYSDYPSAKQAIDLFTEKPLTDWFYGD